MLHWGARVIGSPYYWAFVAAITVVFAVIDINALSRRAMGRAHGLAVAVYAATWVIVAGLSLPIAPLGSLWWLFPAAVRVAVFAMFLGGQLLAEAVRAEQAIVHPEQHRAEPTVPKHKLTEEELRVAEEYDAQWQIEDRQRNSQSARREPETHAHPISLNPHEEGAGGEGDFIASARVEFERLVQDAIDRLPTDLRGYMSNVSIVVEDEPPRDESLLGLYQGIPLTSRGRGYAGALPDKITIYSGPLERDCGNDPDRLASEVRRAVWHEIAHHFGISDRRLIDIDRY